MRVALGVDGRDPVLAVGAEGVRHAHQRRSGLPLLQEVVEVFPGMLATGHEQHDRVLTPTDERTGVQAPAFRIPRLVLVHQLQNTHPGVILAEQIAVGRHPGQLHLDGKQGPHHRLDHLALGARRQGHAEVLLQLRQTVVGRTHPAVQYRQHGLGRWGVFLPGIHARLRREVHAAQGAAQALQLVARGQERRLPGKHDALGRIHRVHLPLAALGTDVARAEAVGTVDHHSTGVVGDLQATVPLDRLARGFGR